MGDSVGEAFHLGGLLLQSFLQLLALGDVTDHMHCVDHLAVGVADRTEMDLIPMALQGRVAKLPSDGEILARKGTAPVFLGCGEVACEVSQRLEHRVAGH